MSRPIKAMYSLVGNIDEKYLRNIKAACAEQNVSLIEVSLFDNVLMEPGPDEISQAMARMRIEEHASEAQIYLGVLARPRGSWAGDSDFAKKINLTRHARSTRTVGRAELEYHVAVEKLLPRLIFIEAGKWQPFARLDTSALGELMLPTQDQSKSSNDLESAETHDPYEKLKRLWMQENPGYREFSSPEQLRAPISNALRLYRGVGLSHAPTGPGVEHAFEIDTPAVALPRKTVFISYSHADWEKYARPLVHKLRGKSVNCWVAPPRTDHELERGIEAGEDWLDEINKALKSCEVMALCVSPDALESKYVKIEYRYFFNRNKTVLPIICRDAELPAELDGLQHYDYEQIDAIVEKLSRLSR